MISFVKSEFGALFLVFVSALVGVFLGPCLSSGPFRCFCVGSASGGFLEELEEFPCEGGFLGSPLHVMMPSCIHLWRALALQAYRGPMTYERQFSGSPSISSRTLVRCPSLWIRMRVGHSTLWAFQLSLYVALIAGTLWVSVFTITKT